ncbi:hypothetical protein PQO03_19555 [Lentisphaera profundi]|uniref:Lipocalin-like domain-containing protein n=1 Tax=Lentisphaera profundi TaxID=1658616 RepID=A0ABY7VXS5_9BACT|nr:hypothetical protein [Lentisphaera profundi]WDE98020.1 hypothetical protein PQO03_19555 [Lentisphaera profundi]
MKFLYILIALASFQVMSAETKKQNFSDFILGRWTFDIPNSIKEQEKTLKKALPEKLKNQIKEQLEGSIVIIKKNEIEVLLIASEKKLKYTVDEVGPNYIKTSITYPLGAVEKRTFIYEKESLYIREGSKNYMILKKVIKK